MVELTRRHCNSLAGAAIYPLDSADSESSLQYSGRTTKIEALAPDRDEIWYQCACNPQVLWDVR